MGVGEGEGVIAVALEHRETGAGAIALVVELFVGAAITPSNVTDEPTIPVAAAKMVAVIITARYKDPLIPANNCCMA